MVATQADRTWQGHNYFWQEKAFSIVTENIFSLKKTNAAATSKDW